MAAIKENARVQGEREVTSEETELSKAHGRNDAVRRPSDTPSFDDVEFLARASFDVIPLRDGSKAPRDRDWPNCRYDPIAVIAEARARGGNLGVRLGPSDLVVDVDPRNGGEASLRALVADAGLELDHCPHVATGGGGHHYYLRKPEGFATVCKLPQYPGIDFKKQGGQVVAPGSVHPDTGRRYESDFWMLGPDETPEAPDALLELLRVRQVAMPAGTGDAGRWGELAPEQLAAALAKLPPEKYGEGTHDEWFQLMCACHHATAGAGREEFIAWSTQAAGYGDHAESVGYRWDSLACRTGQGGRPTTVRHLHQVLAKHGAGVPHVAPEDDFDAYEDPAELGRGVDDAALRAPPKATGIEAVIDELNEKHCVVMEGGKFRVFTEMFDPVLRRPFFQRSTKEDFQNLYLNQLVERSNEKPQPKAHFWLKNPRRRQYHGVIFDPSQEHTGWLNLWRGWAVQPKKGDWSLLRQLILDVLVDGDREHFDYVMDWMAHMVQRPAEVAEVALCFKGRKGTGKGTLGRALAALAGSNGLHISSPEHLVGRFNSHLQNCVCLFADEAFWAGDKAGESKLKQLVTEPTIAYEGKGRDAVMGKNLVHIVMASNNDWVVPAGLGDERRFAVFEVNDARRGDKPFFDALNRQLREGGLAAMLHDLLLRDIGDWAPRDDVPSSAALADQKIRGLDLEHEWWLSLLQSGERPSDDLEGVPAEELTGGPTAWGCEPARVLCSTLRDSYQAYAKNKRRSWKSNDSLGKFIAGMGVAREQVGTKRYRGKWCYVIPPIGQALHMMANALGVTVERLSS
ncbi:bifunctional DNA primase/polymerase [Xanthomonas campestris pv. raphani]|uniref:bifunctional DNA primase/polymerase n=1 Tax=Xanthomonas campestris TaxID=339 RepID=UPI002B22DE59|nr:bifunctional DNA primase/polymerase [Xanthomonas campestris]MEA9913503.1 bifunctional DNA primase/polymerase [Xanthomonas campestris pv. raphani]